MTFRLADPDGHLAAVRLFSDLHLSEEERTFARDGDEWVLRVDPPPIARLEYLLELVHADGGTELVCEPGNPHRAPGAFGEKSVALTPGYAPPRWLDHEGVPAEIIEFGVRGHGLGAEVPIRLWSPADAAEPLPLLIAHDGPEYDELSRLTRYAGAMIAAGELPRHRVALLAPGERDEWYSASAVYARVLCTEVVPALSDAVAVAGLPVAMGASLGGLAMLHAHRRWPGTFAGLFLQSGSFFIPRYDAMESRFPRYGRIVRVVRGILRTTEHHEPVPVALTCGVAEENLANNRMMTAALRAQGYEAVLDEVPDMHNYTGWRDAFDPYLTRLLRRVWAW
jgi:enterochelin esterase family protein